MDTCAILQTEMIAVPTQILVYDVSDESFLYDYISKYAIGNGNYFSSF